MSRSRKVTFELNTGVNGGATVIQGMVQPAVEKAAQRICDRADRISSSIRSHPNKFEYELQLGMPNRRGGIRCYALVTGKNNAHSADERYQDYQTLTLAADAGRVTRLGA